MPPRSVTTRVATVTCMLRRFLSGRSSARQAPAPPAEPVADGGTALEVIAGSIARLRAIDPADTTAILAAAWHGFGVAQAAGSLLAYDNPGDALLARQTRPVFRTVTTLLMAAPSLPYTDHGVELVDGLAPEGCAAETYFRDTYDEAPDPSVAGAVRRGILALALELNTLLPRAAELARDPADEAACRHGTGLAYEVSRCWHSRPGSFLNTTSRGY